MKALLALVLSLASLGANAAPPSDESIQTLFKVMKAETLLDGIYASIEPVMRQSIAQASQGQTLTDQQRRLMELAPQRLSELLRRELSWAKLEPIQLAIYRETFDQAEIDGLIAFYRTPVGQAFVDKMPLASQRAMLATQRQMQEVTPKIKAAMDALMAEVQAAK